MMKALEKRTRETLRFDLGCWSLLPAGVTISGAPSMLPSEPAGLTFGAPAVNSAPITYPGGFIAPTGTVVQVLVGGGEVPTGKAAQRYVVRCTFATTISGELVEATAPLLVTDEP